MGRLTTAAGALLVIVGVLAIITIYIPIILILVILMMAMLGIAMLGALLFWASGAKIDIKVDDKTIGYVRWLKFYPIEQPLSIEETKRPLGASESFPVNSTGEGMQLWLERKNKK